MSTDEGMSRVPELLRDLATEFQRLQTENRSLHERLGNLQKAPTAKSPSTSDIEEAAAMVAAEQDAQVAEEGRTEQLRTAPVQYGDITHGKRSALCNGADGQAASATHRHRGKWGPQAGGDSNALRALMDKDAAAAEAAAKLGTSSQQVFFVDKTTPLGRWLMMIECAKKRMAEVAKLAELHMSWEAYLHDTDDFAGGSNMLGGHQLLTHIAVANQQHQQQRNTAPRHSFGKDSKAVLQAGLHPFQLFRDTGRKSVMRPNSKYRTLWDFLGIVLLAHDMVTIPLQFFSDGTTGLPETYTDFRDQLELYAAIFWTVDIGVGFLTGYYKREGILEMRPKYIALNYLRTWFFLDLTIVTVDWITFILDLGSSSGSGLMRLGKTVSRFMRVARLLRFMKLNMVIKELLATINSEYILTVVGLLKIVVLIVIINHYIACMWYGLSRWPKTNRTWSKKFLNHTDSISYAYATSLHWALTQFTPASMEVVPQNEYERFFNAVVIIVALVAFSSFVSSITQAMTYIRHLNSKKSDMEAAIRRYFGEKRISRELASRVWSFLRQNRIMVTRLKEQDVPALKSLPLRIKEDLRQEAFLPTLMAHPLLSYYNRMEPENMRKVCCSAVSERSMLQGEELFQTRSDADKIKDMYFVSYGSLLYIDSTKADAGFLDKYLAKLSEGGTEFLTVYHGGWVCELAMWAQRARLDGTLVAGQGGAELVVLSAAMFKALTTRQGRDSTAFLAKYASLFIEEFNKATEDPNFTNVLFNDPEQVHEWIVNATSSVAGR